MYKNNDSTGFTLAETMVSISVLVILFAISIPGFRSFITSQDVDQAKEIVVSALRQAQKKTIASHGQGNWGVYFATTTSPHQAVIFFGASYAARDSSQDSVSSLPSTTIISAISPDAMKEVVFERITGAATTSAEITVALAADASSGKTVYLDESGQISAGSFSAQSGSERAVDARHVHFAYSNAIDTTETTGDSIILNFNNGSNITTLPIADNLSGSQFYWSENVTVNGSVQRITLKTIRLNNPDTLFCLVRDRRYNNVELKIDLASQTMLAMSPTLLGVSANGLTTATGTSFFVSGPIWQ